MRMTDPHCHLKAFGSTANLSLGGRSDVASAKSRKIFGFPVDAAVPPRYAGENEGADIAGEALMTATERLI
jgi:hypothetical protein